jgi:SAM-dependent methyltransferase
MSQPAAIVCWNGRRMQIGETLDRQEIADIIAHTQRKDLCMHPEAVWLHPYCVGLTADIGCGAEKVHPAALGLDKLAPGEAGKTGCMIGRGSCADVSVDAGDLAIFADGTFDSVVSRHCFEHLPDPKETLREWLRILRKGGRLAMVLPNDSWRDFKNMDPDHKFCCYPETVKTALDQLNAVGGSVQGRLIENGTMVYPNWSFFSLIERI